MVTLVECVYKWLTFFSILSLLVDLSQQYSKCHMQETEKSQIGTPPYEFKMSDIPFSTRKGMVQRSGTTRIIDYKYYVYSSCMLEVYMLSDRIEMPITMINAMADMNIDKWIVNCDVLGIDVDPKPVIAVFKLLQAKSSHYRFSIPKQWLEDDDRGLLTVQMQKVPDVQEFSIYCNLDKTGTAGEIQLQGTLTVSKIGCPNGMYGRLCDRPCGQCPTNSSCHSIFGFPCYCPDGVEGRQCNKVTQPGVTVPVFTVPSTVPTIQPDQTSNDNPSDNSDEDPNDKVRAQGATIMASGVNTVITAVYVILLYRLLSLL